MSLTDVAGKVQVAYTNPAWMANAYRMGGDLADVAAALGTALGAGVPFGAKDGLHGRAAAFLPLHGDDALFH